MDVQWLETGINGYILNYHIDWSLHRTIDQKATTKSNKEKNSASNIDMYQHKSVKIECFGINVTTKLTRIPSYISLISIYLLKCAPIARYAVYVYDVCSEIFNKKTGVHRECEFIFALMILE